MAHHVGSQSHVSQGSVAVPGIIGSSTARPSNYSMGAMQGAKHGTKHSNLSYGGKPLVRYAQEIDYTKHNYVQFRFVQTAAQQAFMGNIQLGFNAVQSAQDDLDGRTDLPPIGSDAVNMIYCYFPQLLKT